MTKIVTFYFMSRKEYTTNNPGNLGLRYFLPKAIVQRVFTSRGWERKELLKEAVNLIQDPS